MRYLILSFILAVSACASKPRTSPEQFQAALDAARAETDALSQAGKLPSLQGYVAAFYLRLQQRVPDLPSYTHAYYRHMMEYAPMVDAGKMTAEELITGAELRRIEVARSEARAEDAETRARWAAGLQSASDAFKRPTVNCTSSTLAGYTQTTCR